MMMSTSTAYKPLQLQVVQCLEEVLIVNLKLSSLQVNVLYPHVLIVIAYLVGMGIQSAVRSDDTIAVEVIIRGRILAIVAAIGKDGATRDGTLVAHTLVHEVPNVAALVLGILADDVPVLLETAHGVTHRVGVFTLNQGAGIVAL